ncbi:MAG: hypothetical protein WD069_02990 [Planctomycetales bacterium]
MGRMPTARTDRRSIPRRTLIPVAAALLTLLGAAGCRTVTSGGPIAHAVSATDRSVAGPRRPRPIASATAGVESPVAGSRAAQPAALEPIVELEPAGQRSGFTRWLDRFTGPKRLPLPLAASGADAGEPPAIAAADPFGEP